MELVNSRKIKIAVQGEDVAHHFEELRSREWLDYQKRIAAFDGGDEEDRFRRMLLEAYDARCVKVEGYTHLGADIMAARPEDWRDFIPGNHKYLAMMELIGGADLKKN